jgi:hypothetical protein
MSVCVGRFARLVAACSLGLVVMMATARGLAASDPSAEDRTTARELALEGHNALQAGDYALAVDRFSRADHLVHAPTILVDLGRSYIGLGRLVQAHETFQQVIREGVAADAPAPWHKALQAAKEEDARLKPRLAWVTIRVEGADTPNVQLDGEPLPAASLGVKRAVDPGHRSVTAGAEGFFQAMGSLDLAEGEASELRLVLRRDPSYVPPKKKEPSRPRQVIVVHEAQPRVNTPAYVAYGIGAGGVILGGVSSALMFKARAELQRRPECQNRLCVNPPPEVVSEVSTYRTFGWLAGVGWGVAVAGAGVGTYFLLSRPSKARAYRTTTLSAQLSPGYVGLSGSF